MSEMHYMKLSDDFEKELREKGNIVTESQHVAILTFAIWLEKYVAEQSVHPTAAGVARPTPPDLGETGVEFKAALKEGKPKFGVFINR